MKMKSVAILVTLAAAGAAVASDISQVNGYRVDMRVFNDFPDPIAAASFGPAGGPFTNAPAPASFTQTPASSLQMNHYFQNGAVGNFANKHVGYFSQDGGATQYGHNVAQSFTIDMDVRINATSIGPRKEGGIRVENPRPALGYTDEGLVLVASDGEVAVFGGVMPFHTFGNVYTANTTAHMSFQYFAPGTAHATLGGYRLVFTDTVTGVHDTGLKLWGAGEPDGTAGYNTGTRFGLVSQAQRNPFVADSAEMIYSNVSLVPAPSALALLGLGGLVAGRRRR